MDSVDLTTKIRQVVQINRLQGKGKGVVLTWNDLLGVRDSFFMCFLEKKLAPRLRKMDKDFKDRNWLYAGYAESYENGDYGVVFLVLEGSPSRGYLYIDEQQITFLPWGKPRRAVYLHINDTERVVVV